MTEHLELTHAEIVLAILRRAPQRWPRLFCLLARVVWRDARFRLRCRRYGHDAREIHRRVRLERMSRRVSQ